MTDLSALSDEELTALYQREQTVSQVMPALIAQESGGRAGVTGPQTPYGRAQGLTQMLPATAQEMAGKLGVPWRPELMGANTPDAAEYQRRLGEAYFAEGLEKTGNVGDALKYYHGGPNKQLWGPKTEAYAAQVQGRMAPDLSAMSDEELIAAYQGGQAPQTPQEAPRPAARPVAAPPPKLPTSQALGAAKGIAPSLPRYAQALDLLAGSNPVLRAPLLAASALTKRGGEAIEAGNAKAEQTARPGILGQIGGGILATLPTMGLGPAAGGAASGFLLSEGENPLEVGRDMAIGAVTGKVADEAVRLLGKLPRTMTREQLEGARTAAYQAVDNMGVAYKPDAVKSLVTGMSDEMTAGSINKLRHPKAFSMLAQIKAHKGPLTLTELDQLRQVIRRDVASAPDAAERFFGQKMIANIDEFIQAAGPDQVASGNPQAAAQSIKAARDLHMRLRKLDAFEEALGKAENRTAVTGSGGNIDNATRQNVLRVADKTKNLTPEERKAAMKVVKPGFVSDTLRTVGKLSPQGSGLMTALSIGGTIANPALAIPSLIGVGAKATADALTKRNVDDLLRIITNGGRPATRVAPAAIRRPVAVAAAAGAATATPVAAKQRK